MARFARIRRVFFFEEPVFDAPGEPRLHVERVEDGLHVCVPHLPPHASGAGVLAAQRALLDELADAHALRPEVLWFYTPMALELADGLHARRVVYDCMDELSAFAGAPPRLRELERALFERAHIVFTGGHSLYESKRRHHPRVHALPSSVEPEHYLRARVPQDDPPDQASIPHPRAGYFGVIDERLDLSLIEQLADARPDLQLVFLGPIVKVDPNALPRRPNLHWLGMKKYEELPSYLAGWDVALMPFALNEATRFISPTKTLEYLAAGLPVVSTAIRDVVRPYGERGLVHVADASTFAHAVDEARATDRARHRAAADAFVARTSWDSTWNRMRELIEALDDVRERNAPQVSIGEDAARCSTT
ncbi:Glycosyltransferase [Sandaracinus amylolyticus]|uniref:Glycosyltransferase n=2 Tax=Sandaracinus amylolyticus TaxID=927083 RepID=A0A0F6YGD9_9BACT|nr:Glycosyltransferase [Sandaracinus amylolyticus]